MTKEIQERKKGELVHKLVQEMKQADINILRGILIKGRNLDRIEKEELWQYYGEHLRNFDPDFLNELRYSTATAYNYIRIWRKFGEYLLSKELLQIDPTRLIKLLPVAKEGNIEEWITRAQEDPKQQFEDAIREAKGKIPSDECDCPDNEQLLYTRCRICGRWIKRDLDYFKELIDKKDVEKEKV